ncbi:MAG TPA: cyclase family protein [Vicinamibacterales bacterium]|nr:cyclase family protein [Vicinamibacterales bacterium]
MRRATLHVVTALVVSVSVGCTSPESAPESRGIDLNRLSEEIASGSVRVVDLAQTLNEQTPVIQLPPPFANTPGYERHLISEFDDKGPGWYWSWFSVGEHVGTHFDAPCHWATGKGKACVDTIEAREFVGPAVVLDVTDEAGKNPDFIVTRATIEQWEERNGRIPPRAWVLLKSGWASRAADSGAFFNVGADGMPHYPGFGQESAEFLTRDRDILGVGTEAVGTDAGIGAAADPAFPNHSIMHGAGKFGLTQLANLDQLPAVGAILVAAPLKLERGSGSPVRPIAIVPAR